MLAAPGNVIGGRLRQRPINCQRLVRVSNDAPLLHELKHLQPLRNFHKFEHVLKCLAWARCSVHLERMEPIRTEHFKTRKAERTHQRVLGVAIKLFQSKGYDETSMRDISAKAKLGLGALYYHFPSKDALVQAFYEQVNAQVREDFLARPASGGFTEQLQQLLELKLTYLAPHRDVFRVLLKHTLDPASRLSPLGTGGRAARLASVELFERLLARGRPELCEVERPLYARALWLAHLGLLLYWALDPSPAQHRTRELLRKLTAGLRSAEALARVPALRNLERQVVSALTDLVPTDSEGSMT